MFAMIQIMRWTRLVQKLSQLQDQSPQPRCGSQHQRQQPAQQRLLHGAKRWHRESRKELQLQLPRPQPPPHLPYPRPCQLPEELRQRKEAAARPD